MHDLELLVTDLEWRRLRRRVVLHPAEALLLNCGTWARITLLKLAGR